MKKIRDFFFYLTMIWENLKFNQIFKSTKINSKKAYVITLLHQKSVKPVNNDIFNNSQKKIFSKYKIPTFLLNLFSWQENSEESLSSGKFKPQTINFLMRKIKIKQYN
jgi:hypothetical protein